MKILSISPERERKKEEAFLFRLSFLNLPYLAAVTPPGVEVKIVDEAFEKINFAEKVWPDLIEDLRRGQMRRIYTGGEFVNPSDLPLPRRDLLNEKFYFPLKLLETTRGC